MPSVTTLSSRFTIQMRKYSPPEPVKRNSSIVVPEGGSDTGVVAAAVVASIRNFLSVASPDAEEPEHTGARQRPARPAGIVPDGEPHDSAKEQDAGNGDRVATRIGVAHRSLELFQPWRFDAQPQPAVGGL